MAGRAPVKKVLHAHGCTKCKSWFQDTCEKSDVNGLCGICKGFKGAEFLMDGHRPRDCCLYYSRPVRKDKERNEKVMYGLAGNADWYICEECKRCQIFLPGTPGDPRKRNGNGNASG